MSYTHIIAPSDVHPSRLEGLQPKVENSLDKASFDLKNSIVRLEFDFGQGTKNGTGFFVNLPSNKYDIILTAAHNLMNKDRIRATNLKVVYGPGDFDLVMDFNVCSQYEKDPGSTLKGSYDYGIILLPKDKAKEDKRQGLGLSLGLSSDATLKNSSEAHVSGYNAENLSLPLRHSSGSLKIGGKQFLEYKAPTEQGMSGSPVWVPYGGHPMVVGIHNTRPDQKIKNSGSTGTKITEEVFRNICDWSETGFFGRRLRAAKRKNCPYNTYLCFYQNSDFAKVFLGSSEEASKQDNVTFDMLPATVFPRWAETASKSALYAFKFHRPKAWGGDKDEEKKCWVEWQPTKQKAILVDSLKDINLVKFKSISNGSKTQLLIDTPTLEGMNSVQELRLYDDDRDDDDVEDGMTEFAGVSFGGWKMTAGMKGSSKLVIE